MLKEGIFYTHTHTSFFKLLTGQKSGRKSRTAQNAIKLQKQAFQKIKTQNFAKCRKKAFFKRTHTNIFKLVRTTLAECEPQKPYFLQHPVKEVSRSSALCTNSGVYFHKTELLARGGGKLWFLAFFVVATLFLWNAYFYSAKRRGPWTGF